MNFGNEAEASKARAQIWQSRAGMKSTVEWMVPARRAQPGVAHLVAWDWSRSAVASRLGGTLSRPLSAQ